MQYRFDTFLLDLDRGLLLNGEDEVATEPQAYSLLSLLVMNHDRMISKDEIVEKIWDGRIVSDAAISTVVKTARRALNDDGTVQKFIRTVRGRGFRFVGKVTPVSASLVFDREPLKDSQATDPDLVSTRPSIAILPFRMVGYSADYSAISEAIPAELISSLSRLRWLRVVSRGSTFRFSTETPDLDAVRATLGANYCLAGIVEIFGAVLAVSVELSDTRSKEVVWSERFSGKIDDVHQTRNEIVAHVISALELHIPLNEAELARIRSPERLDAWGVYHLGLQHMYRFNRTDNQIAAGHFQKATQLDPSFARAFAAQSFTSFQNAFLNYSSDRDREIDNAMRYAERCYDLDPVDPFGNFTLGRAHWLRGEPERGLPWIDRAVGLSPNFAQGFYAHAWADVMAGRGGDALTQVNRAIDLSPLDPFLYAMLSTRGLAYMHELDFDNAAIWAEKGARAPGAHYLISAIAAAICKMKGDDQKAEYWIRIVREKQPDTSVSTFFAAFPFEDGDMKKRMTLALTSLGLRA